MMADYYMPVRSVFQTNHALLTSPGQSSAESKLPKNTNTGVFLSYWHMSVCGTQLPLAILHHMTVNHLVSVIC